MFTYDEIYKMLKGSYKKLKSYYFYDKTLMYIKEKIADFEYNNELFETSLKDLATNLLNQNSLYFDNLINKINYRVLPKKLESITNESKVIKSNIDNKKYLKKLNFYIDMPMELYILDFLWMLILGKLSHDNNTSNSFSYAGKLKKSLYKKNVDSIFDGIDFESNRCYEPYYYSYSSWRDNAFNTIKDNNNSDTVMLSLDLKSFYYTVDFNFEMIDKFLNKDYRLQDITYLTKTMEKIYNNYTKLISNYKKGIRKHNNNYIFPIGLVSPILLRELYLLDLDKQIADKIKPLYYGRYVDDMLIVVEATTDMSNFNEIELIETFILSKGIAENSGDKNLKFKHYPNLKLQIDKINTFFFEKNCKNILLDIYYDKIRYNSSEANLLPEVDIINESFNNKAYDIENLQKSLKIRDLGIMASNKLKATKYINGLKKILKNTYETNYDIEKYLDEIIDFYGGSQAIELMNSWSSVFELFVLTHDEKRANVLFKKIKQYIKELNFDNLNDDELLNKNKNGKKILKKLKEDVQNHLDIAISSSIALDFRIVKLRKHTTLAEKLRITNMFNHNLVSLPLINYTNIFDYKKLPLINIDITNIFQNESQKESYFKLDKIKLEFSPRFIHLDEFYLCNFLFYFNERYQNNIDNIQSIFDKYAEYNGLKYFLKNPCSFEEKQGYNCKIVNIVTKDNSSNQFNVGLVNTNMSENHATDAITNYKSLLTFENKERLFKLLNASAKEDTQFLVFPEFYLPIEWVHDVSKFVKNKNITIVTGLKYIKLNGRAYNLTCTIKPFTDKSKFNNCLLMFREKNYYAPAEKVFLSKLGYKSEDNEAPEYFIVDNGKFKFGTILCFEFTDIESRASLKSQINILFVPQFNKDTHYFSSLVESTARDLHCLVIQANTSKYGDSRVTGPYSSDYKNIMQIKGGNNDIVIVSKVDIGKLIESGHDYENNLKKVISTCLECNSSKSKKNKDLERCEKCTNKLVKTEIKGTPPNFKIPSYNK